MKQLLRAAAILAATATLTVPASAADPVYPPGLHVGLVPMAGLAAATEFSGFESMDRKVKIGITEIPEGAFAAVDAAYKSGKPAPKGSIKPEEFQTAAGKSYFTSESGKDKDGTEVHNYSLILPGNKFSGYVIAQVRDGAGKTFTEDAIRTMLATTALRPVVPVKEQLDLLAFNITDLANFKTVRTLAPRSAVMLTDGDEDTTMDSAPYMVIGLMSGAPAQTDDRERFARQSAATIPGLREARITSSEPLRIDGTPGFETRIEAVTGKNETPVTVVQWLRFGSGPMALRIIASAKRDDWPKAFPRFRAVRDGIQPR
ncbi:MAG: hypothetical protein ACTHM2_13005 [Afipia sp.]|jgi:hypothetical protein